MFRKYLAFSIYGTRSALTECIRDLGAYPYFDTNSRFRCRDGLFLDSRGFTWIGLALDLGRYGYRNSIDLRRRRDARHIHGRAGSDDD